MQAARKRSSRFSTAPVKRPNGSIIKVEQPTACDAAVIKALAHYHFLDHEYLAALTDFSAGHIQDRFQYLRSKPNEWIQLVDEQADNPLSSLRSKLHYQLTRKGRGYAELQGVVPFYRCLRSTSFAHDLIANQVMASFEIGIIEDTTVEPRWPEDILSYEKTPEATRNALHPFQIPVTYEWAGGTVTSAVRPDAKVFGFNRTALPRGRFIFCALEVDCATEPLKSKDFERSGIRRKAVEYLEILRQEIYRSHFGFPNLFILFVATTESRKNSLMDAIERASDERKCKHLLRYFAFKTHPHLYSQERPRPTDHMLTEPWKRIRCDDLWLSKS
jgi:hypothetical protein